MREAVAAHEIPLVFKYHVFMCFQQRPAGHPRGSCGAQGAGPLWEYLIKQVDQLGRPEISTTATGCFGFCSAGPLMVVYPQGIWYRPRSREDIDAIVSQHLIGGDLVERLAIVPQ